jgi:hypothetical protein
MEMRHKKVVPQQQGCSNPALSSDGDYSITGNLGQGQFTDSSSSSSQFSSIPDLSTEKHFQSFNMDPRLSDPYLKKFFFRQRISSHSKHPNVHYHCPLRTQDPALCEKHKCIKWRLRQAKNSSSSITDRPPLYVDNEADVEENDTTTDACCFDDFDFFHPTPCPPEEDEEENVSDASLNRTPIDMNSLSAMIHTRSATMTSATIKEDELLENAKQNAQQRSRSARSAIGSTEKTNKSPNTITIPPPCDINEATHPSDCSWASSSSSTSSSSHSMTMDNVFGVTTTRDEPNLRPS